MINNIWDERQFKTVESVLSTVDKPTIDRCIMEEMKQYLGNLAVFYDYKKVYDMIN